MRGDLEALYLKEAWRSHWLDLHDDLSGQTCTASTLARIGWLERTTRERHGDLQRLLAVEPQRQLVEELRRARQLAERWQIA